MQRRTNASAAIKNAWKIGCSQMPKVYSFGEKSSMESNNSYNQLCHTIIKQRVYSSRSCPMNDIVPAWINFLDKRFLYLVVVRNQPFSFWNRIAGNFRLWTSDHKLCIHNWCLLLHYRRTNYQILLRQYCCPSFPYVASATCVCSSSWL